MTNLGAGAFTDFFKGLARHTIPSELKMEQVIKLFRKYDSDRSNGIDFMELEDLLRDMKLGQKEMMQASRRFEGVDEVKLHEFIIWFHDFSVEVDPSKLTMAEVTKTFDMHDTDGSGELDSTELHKVIKHLRLSKRNETDCKNDFRFNKNGKFGIDKIGFICWFHTLHANNDLDPQQPSAGDDTGDRSGSFSIVLRQPGEPVSGETGVSAETKEQYTERIGAVFRKNNPAMMSKLRSLIEKNNSGPGELHKLYLRVCKKYKIRPKAEFKTSKKDAFPDLPGTDSPFKPGDKVMAKVSKMSSRSQEATVSRVDGKHVIVRWASGKTQRLPIENVTLRGGSKPRKAQGDVPSLLASANDAGANDAIRKKHSRRFEKLEKALKRANVSKSGSLSQSDFTRAMGPTGLKMKLSASEIRNVWSFFNRNKSVSVSISMILDRLCLLLGAGSSIDGVTIKKDVQSFKSKFSRFRTKY